MVFELLDSSSPQVYLEWKQEVVGDDTPALEAVLDVLEERRDLMREIKEIEAAEGEATGRLAQIHDRLVEIDADAKPSQAAEILHGLGLVHILPICLSQEENLFDDVG